jgi:hypothetical protein
MASRILAQIIVAGGTAVLRAATQAWAQALQSGWRGRRAAHAPAPHGGMQPGRPGAPNAPRLLACRPCPHPAPPCLTHLGPADAQKSGVAAETLKQATRAGQVTLQEARMILGIQEGAPWPEIAKVGPTPGTPAA